MTTPTTNPKQPQTILLPISPTCNLFATALHTTTQQNINNPASAANYQRLTQHSSTCPLTFYHSLRTHTHILPPASPPLTKPTVNFTASSSLPHIHTTDIFPVPATPQKTIYAPTFTTLNHPASQYPIANKTATSINATWTHQIPETRNLNLLSASNHWFTEPLQQNIHILKEIKADIPTDHCN